MKIMLIEFWEEEDEKYNVKEIYEGKEELAMLCSGKSKEEIKSMVAAYNESVNEEEELDDEHVTINGISEFNEIENRLEIENARSNVLSSDDEIEIKETMGDLIGIYGRGKKVKERRDFLCRFRDNVLPEFDYDNHFGDVKARLRKLFEEEDEKYEKHEMKNICKKKHNFVLSCNELATPKTKSAIEKYNERVKKRSNDEKHNKRK